MESPAHSKKQIIYYSGTHRHKRANSAFLMGGFLVVMLGWTPEEAFRPFMGTYIALSLSLSLTLSLLHSRAVMSLSRRLPAIHSIS